MYVHTTTQFWPHSSSHHTCNIPNTETMTRNRLFILLLLSVAVWWLPNASGHAEDTPQFLELILTVDHGHLTLECQTLRAGPFLPPRQLEFQEGLWVLQAEDATGQLRYTSTFRDPCIQHVDEFSSDPSERGRLRGHRLTLARATFVIRLPHDRLLTRLRFFRLKQSIDAQTLEAVAFEGSPSSGPMPRARLPARVLKPIGSLTLTVP